MDASKIGQVLRERRAEVLEAWLHRVCERPVARGLPREAVLNNMPAILDELIEALMQPGPGKAVAEIPRGVAEKHGECRLDLGYPLDELGEEYNSFRDALLDVVDAAGLPLNNATASALHGAVDQAQRAGVERYIQLREKRLADRQSDFLARLAHDFRSPLSVILSTVAMARRAGATAAVNLDRIDSAARRLLFLVEGQLATEEALSGHLHIKRSEVDIALLAEDLLEIMRPRAEAKGLDLRSDIPFGLRLNTDRLLLGQVLQNLLDNSLKYTEAGSVALLARADGDAVELAVIDTGRGIAAEVLPAIFDMYRRSEHLTAGHGVGLAVVREITSALEGEVRAHSEVGRGTRMTVRLPATRTPARREDH